MPPGWTDDCSVELPAGRKVDDVVDLVLACRREQRTHTATIAELTTFGLSPDDADVAVDRVCGGLVRAGTGNSANKPSRKKDPLAFVSYPWTHSLLTAIAWGLLFAFVALKGRVRPVRDFSWMAAVVVSHWGLDLLTHRPDLPLAPGASRPGQGLQEPRGLAGAGRARRRLTEPPGHVKARSLLTGETTTTGQR